MTATPRRLTLERQQRAQDLRAKPAPPPVCKLVRHYDDEPLEPLAKPDTPAGHRYSAYLRALDALEEGQRLVVRKSYVDKADIEREAGECGAFVRKGTGEPRAEKVECCTQRLLQLLVRMPCTTCGGGLEVVRDSISRAGEYTVSLKCTRVLDKGGVKGCRHKVEVVSLGCPDDLSHPIKMPRPVVPGHVYPTYSAEAPEPTMPFRTVSEVDQVLSCMFARMEAPAIRRYQASTSGAQSSNKDIKMFHRWVLPLVASVRAEDMALVHSERERLDAERAKTNDASLSTLSVDTRWDQIGNNANHSSTVCVDESMGSAVDTPAVIVAASHLCKDHDAEFRQDGWGAPFDPDCSSGSMDSCGTQLAEQDVLAAGLGYNVHVQDGDRTTANAMPSYLEAWSKRNLERGLPHVTHIRYCINHVMRALGKVIRTKIHQVRCKCKSVCIRADSENMVAGLIQTSLMGALLDVEVPATQAGMAKAKAKYAAGLKQRLQHFFDTSHAAGCVHPTDWKARRCHALTCEQQCIWLYKKVQVMLVNRFHEMMVPGSGVSTTNTPESCMNIYRMFTPKGVGRARGATAYVLLAMMADMHINQRFLLDRFPGVANWKTRLAGLVAKALGVASSRLHPKRVRALVDKEARASLKRSLGRKAPAARDRRRALRREKKYLKKLKAASTSPDLSAHAKLTASGMVALEGLLEHQTALKSSLGVYFVTTKDSSKKHNSAVQSAAKTAKRKKTDHGAAPKRAKSVDQAGGSGEPDYDYSKGCRCGSTTHKSINHGSCPLNKKNQLTAKVAAHKHKLAALAAAATPSSTATAGGSSAVATPTTAVAAPDPQVHLALVHEQRLIALLTDFSTNASAL